jgi:hypothetical protein
MPTSFTITLARLLMSVTAVAILTPYASAQRGDQRGDTNPFAQPFDQVFDNFLRSSPEERAALKKVVIDRRVEQNAGQQAVEDYLRGLRSQRIKVERRGDDFRYLTLLVKRVRPLMKQAKRYPKIAVYVAKSGQFDARSFPGGHLVFHDGIFDEVDTEAALVAIIGHELSHIDHGHQLRQLKQIQQMQNTFSNFGRFSPDKMMAQFQSMGKAFHPFHPEDEAQADSDGATWCYQLGYDPAAMARLFDRLSVKHDGKGANAGMPGFLRTHPLNAQRAEIVTSTLADLQKETPRRDLRLGRENLRRREPLEPL